ncbi:MULTISPECIES: acyclic terpene utilization AtuA family protein [Aminobacterium]|uniref:acyclic terpene utilization AtuA family protein n=1 Tax=Aminobacterium TaxID=81466 RepID=UPI000466CFEC|nr:MULTISPECIES: acyclic terpene utilization AtuA family protein [Aminobacterium]
MEKCSLLVSTGNLGDNIIEEESFYEGVKHHIDCFAADAGTADAGPTFLGADKPHNPIEWERHDLEVMLVESRKKNVPMIVGSCSTTGTDRTVDLYGNLIRDIAKDHSLKPFKMALIYSQVDKEELLRRVERGETEPLEADFPLTKEVIDQTTNVTASMGVEQFLYALEQGADVIIAGRACDDAVLAAYPIFKGFHKGISLHMGKAAECASLVCWPQMVKESIIATVHHDHFTIEPMHPKQRATPHSLAAHSMYERTNPFVQGLPGGILDMHESVYETVTDRIAKVSGSKFAPSPDGSYKVKLEGAGEAGHRVYHFVGIRDPRAIEHIDMIIEDTRKKVSHIIGPSRDKDYQLFFHVFGRNAVMKEYEPVIKTQSHELGVFIEVISQDLELATTVAKCAKFRFFYMSYPGQMNSSGGSVALLTDEPLFPQNKCYRWTIDHLLALEDPLDNKIFRYHFEMVGKNK